MSTLQTMFRNDTMSGIFSLTGKVWIPITVAYAVTSIITLLLLAPVLLKIFGFDMSMLQELASGADPEEQMERIQALMAGAAERMIEPVNLLLFLLVIFASAVISMYVMNVAFVANEAKVREEPISMGRILSKSFNSDLLKLFAVYLLIGIMITVVYIMIAAIVGIVAAGLDMLFISVLLGLAGVIGLMTFSMKFILALPAVVHGRMGVGQAISYSFKTITWRKAVKYFLIAIVVGIALMVAMVVIMMIQGLFAFIPVIGTILSQIIGMIIYGFVAAFIYSALSALYFKRSDDIVSEDELSEHLILDS